MAERRERKSNNDYGDRYQYTSQRGQASGRASDRTRQNRQTMSKGQKSGRRTSANQSGNAGFQDLSSYSSSKEYNKRKKNKKGKTIAKVVASIISVLLILLGAAFIYASSYLFEGLTTTDISRDPKELGINSGVVSHKDIKNIALFGIDARGDIFEGRSDAIMVLTIDNVHNKLKMTSILRDSYVEMDGGQFPEEKITHAYAYGGAENAIKTINRNFNLDITDYVTVNFTKMAEIVDAIGGTKVTITEAEMYEINKNLDLLVLDDSTAVVYESDYMYNEFGEVVLNGNQAVAFARIRNVGGDPERAGRQQKVLMGLLENTKDKSLLDYQELVHQVAGMCETSLGIENILTFLPILFNNYTLENLTIPGEYENPVDFTAPDESWVYSYDLTLAGEHIDAFIKESESPYYPIDLPESTDGETAE